MQNVLTEFLQTVIVNLKLQLLMTNNWETALEHLSTPVQVDHVCTHLRVAGIFPIIYM